MVGKDGLLWVNVSHNSGRGIGSRSNALAGEPIQLHGTAATLALERPIDEPKAPTGYPITHSLVGRQVLNVVVKGTSPRLIQILVPVTSTFQFPEEMSLKPPIRLWIVVFNHMTHTHQHAPAITQDRIEGSTGIVSRGVPVSTNQDGKRRIQGLQMIQNDFHLTVPVLLSGMGIQMEADHSHGPARMVDRGNHRLLVSQTLLLTPHQILTIGHRNGMGFTKGISGKKSIAVNGLTVLSRDLAFQSTSFIESNIAGYEGVVELQCLSNLLGNQTVVASRHPQVQFGEKQEVTVLHKGMLFQHPDHTLQMSSPLDVPGGRPNRGSGGGNVWSEILLDHRLEDFLDFRSQSGIHVGGLQGGCGVKATQLGKERAQLMIDPPRGVGRCLQLSRHERAIVAGSGAQARFVTS